MANPALMRTKPTDSDDTKMASIFRDAAHTKERFETTSKNSTSHDKTFRIPISQARTTPFGNKTTRYIDNIDTDTLSGIGIGPKSFRETTNSSRTTYKPRLSYSRSAGIKPIKTGLESGEVNYPIGKRQLSPPTVSDLDLGPSKIRYPRISKVNPRVPRSSSSSMSSDCHSSHGVPLVIPVAGKSEEKIDSIDTWLTEVISPLTANLSIDVSPRHSLACESKKTANVYPTLSPQYLSIHPTEVPSHFRKPTSSNKPLAELYNNKENAPPKNEVVQASPLHPSALMRSPSSVKLSPTRLYSALSPSPHSPLSRPPRRIPKALVSDDNEAYETLGTPSTPFKIHEDDWRSHLSRLSPNVEVYRKKKSPQSKRDRLAASKFEELLRRVEEEKKKQMDRHKRNETIGEEDFGGKDSFRSREGEEIRKGKKRVLGAVSGQSEEWTRQEENRLWSTRMKEEEELLCARLGLGSGFEKGS